MTHPLDRPIWSALTSRHASLAEGGEMARNYPASIAPFAATRDDGPESLEALARLVRPSQRLMLLQSAIVALPAALTVEITADGVQMVASTSPPEPAAPNVVPLGPADVRDMLALATLTRPGPFTERALELGKFWGIREDGHLLAMAGERMKQPGWTEISGVCSHPDARGKGYARLLSRFVAARIAASGDTPYLHAYATNSAAIRLYESIGFEVRRKMKVAALVRAA